MSRWQRRLMMLGLLVSLFLGVAYFFSSLFMPASASPRRVVIEVPAGATANSIGDLLARRGLIRSRHAFVMTARLLGEGKNMKAGQYEVDGSRGLFEIIDQLSHGEAISDLSVTIPEGYTVAQIAALLAEKRMADADRFLELCRQPGRFLDASLPRDSLEGYLLPDTYKFQNGVKEEDIVRGMVNNFRQQVLRDQAEAIRGSGRSVDDIVTMASLIEREARVAAERPKIAAVIRNRLQKRMLLQIDATVLYAMGRHKPRLLFSDLKIRHPYNTYRYPGLPPGPICNPGIDCIKAALDPANVPYLYYVAQKDGSHFFSTTYGEHQRHGGS